MWKTAFYACLLLLALSGYSVVQAQSARVVIDAYPNTTMVEQGTTLILVCRVVGVPSITVLSYQWTCPGGYCDAGAVDPEWAARIQQGNILVVNVRNSSDNGDYTCTVVANTQQVGTATYTLSVANGLSLVNEDGGLRVVFPRNSFVTNTALTHTNIPRMHSASSIPRGDDHIVCYGGNLQAGQVPWYNNGGTRQLVACAVPCTDCGGRCVVNGAIGVDPPFHGQTDIHMYTNVASYVNQDLECRAPNGLSAFIGVYLASGENQDLQPPSSITQGATTTTSVSVSWSQVLNATGYYVSYQRQDLGAPPVVTPQYERIVGGDNTSVTLSGLEPGTTYRIRVWSTDGASVSSGATSKDVTTVERAPSLPRMLTMIGEPTGSTVELNWLPPLHPNGAIHYEIEYEPAMTPGDPVKAGSSSSPYFTLTLPNEFLTYNVTVAAVNTQGQAQSSVLPVCPGQNRQEGPQPPMGISVVASGCNSANTSWNASVSRMCDAVIGNYSVRYRLTSGEGSYVTVSTSSTRATLEDLIPNAEYNVELASINSNGVMSVYSAVTQLMVQDPEPPPNVAAGAIGCNSAMVSWDPSQSMFDDMIMNYSVRYQLTSGTGGSATVYSSSTSVTLQVLAPNAEYTVSVAGINSCGGTSTFTLATFDLQDPAPPTGVSVVPGTECGTADVSWSPSQVNYNAAIGNYSVRYQLRSSTGGYTTVYSSSTSVTLRGLDPSMEYFVEVAAVDSCGRMSGFSMAAQLDLQAPRPPTGVSVEDGAGCYTSVVSWVAPQPVCGVVAGNYSVRYQLRNRGGGYTTVFTPNTSVTLQGITANAEYDVSVAAISSAGELNAFPKATQFELQEPKPPTGVTFTVTCIDSAMVSWTASQSMCDDVVGNYSVRYRLRDDSGAYTTVYTNRPSVTLRDLIPNAEYVVSVAAINSRGDMSALSVETPFTVSTPATPTTPPGPTTDVAGFCQDNGYVAASAAEGAAVGGFVGGFIGGVLLTAVIAVVVAGAVFYRAKKKVTNKTDTKDPLYEDPQPELELQSNPAYEMVDRTAPMK